MTALIQTLPLRASASAVGPGVGDTPEESLRAYVATALQGLFLFLGEQPPTEARDDGAGLAALDSAVNQAVADLAGEVRAIGGDGLRFLGTVTVAVGCRGRFHVGGSLAPEGRCALAEGLDGDPTFSALFYQTEARARALALARMAVQARQALDEAPGLAPDLAEVLWEWLCERGERAKTARFRFMVGDGLAVAFLDDAVGRPLGTWGDAGMVAVAAA